MITPVNVDTVSQLPLIIFRLHSTRCVTSEARCLVDGRRREEEQRRRRRVGARATVADGVFWFDEFSCLNILASCIILRLNIEACVAVLFTEHRLELDFA